MNDSLAAKYEYQNEPSLSACVQTEKADIIKYRISL